MGDLGILCVCCLSYAVKEDDEWLYGYSVSNIDILTYSAVTTWGITD